MSEVIFAEIKYIDSHTCGEPTRVVLSGLPFELNEELAAIEIRNELLRHPAWMRTVTQEPRGREALVGAILSKFDYENTTPALVFFNASGPLEMCGHGLIGVAETLYWMGETTTQRLRFETPAGKVEAVRQADGRWTIENVLSYCLPVDYEFEVQGHGTVKGSIAYGGNWFFLVHNCDIPLKLESKDVLMTYSKAILNEIQNKKIGCDFGAKVDHVEICGKPINANAASKNFVLCPDGCYDRSPCGTGTSAHIAYRAMIGELKENEVWVQESFTGTIFEAQFESEESIDNLPTIRPKITGRAYVVGKGELYFDANDPSIR